MWAAGPAGLVSYDGSRVRSYTVDDGLSRLGLRAVAPVGRDTLWIGSDNGVDCLRNGRIRPLVDEWPFGMVDDIVVGPDGNVCLSTAAGLVHWSEKTGLIKPQAPESGAEVIRALAVDDEGTVWAATGAGLVAFYPRLSQQPMIVVADDPGIVCLCALPDSGVMYFNRAGVSLLGRNGKVTRISTTVDQHVVRSMRLRDDIIWLGTDDGLIRGRLKDNRCEGLLVSQISSPINAITFDSFGNLWAATERLGVAKVSLLNRLIQRVPIPDVGAILCVKRIADGLFVGGDGFSSRIEDKSEQTVREEALATDKVWDMIAVPGGEAVATDLGLKVSKDGTPFRRFESELRVLKHPCRCLAMADGLLWCGSIFGLASVDLDSGEAKEVCPPGSAHMGYVYTLAIDAEDCIWVGTLGNGVWLLRAGRLRRVICETPLEQANVFAIAHTDGGRTAMLSGRFLLIFKDYAHVHTFEIGSDPVLGWALTWEGQDRLWVGSSDGLLLVNAENGEIVRHVNALLGKENWEFTTSRSLLLHKQTLWCGLNSGLVTVDGERIRDLRASPRVRLSKLEWQSAKVMSDGGRIRVKHGQWFVTVSVYCAWYIDEENLRFRYRLVGFNRQWLPMTELAYVQFNSLPPGEYQLEAQAYSPLVGWGPVAVVADFEVTAPVWPTRWLSGPIWLLRNALRMASAKSRNIELQAENQMLEEVVVARTVDLKRANDRLGKLNSELEQRSLTDPLTTVANRRYFDQLLDDEWHRLAVRNRPMAVVLLDIDHFKAFNDHYGHLAGDRCLVDVANCLRELLRRNKELVARYGGEEFAVVLSECDLDEAKATAERLREGIVNLGIIHEKTELGCVSASFGVAVMRPDGDQPTVQLVQAADEALYCAKENGRNQVCVWPKHCSKSIANR
ncbi:MAG: hypothetical protein DHS20C11_04620 [Lysobacteraceae bacterium]|nr:MAG: hypothetical protein DHS20C11_04620 [Xanthomonadaceae bacterium]